MKRIPILILVCCITLLVWQRQRRLENARTQLRESEARAALLQTRLETHWSVVQAERNNVKVHTEARNSGITTLASARTAIAKEDPETVWAEPPSRLPDWVPESPYVWVSKERFRSLPIVPFSPDGEFRREVASMFAMPEPSRKQLSARVAEIEREYETLEAASAQLSTNHLAGMSGPGEKVTIVIFPEEEASKHLQAEFDSALRTAFSTQQYDIMRRLSAGWVGEHLRPESPEPKTISAMRNPDGSFSLSIKRAGNWSSMSGGFNLDQHIPKHLASFFTALQPSEATTAQN